MILLLKSEDGATEGVSKFESLPIFYVTFGHPCWALLLLEVHVSTAQLPIMPLETTPTFSSKTFCRLDHPQQKTWPSFDPIFAHIDAFWPCLLVAFKHSTVTFKRRSCRKIAKAAASLSAPATFSKSCGTSCGEVDQRNSNKMEVPEDIGSMQWQRFLGLGSAWNRTKLDDHCLT